MEYVVARVGRPHGVRGEVTVEVRTDDPDTRFAPGAVLRTDPDRGPLTVATARWHNGTLLLTFEGVEDRTAVEGLRNTRLVVDLDDEADPDDDAWYPHQLQGLAAVTTTGTPLGTVKDLLTGGAQDVLVVTGTDGREVLVPFVTPLVPRVDVKRGKVVLSPPGGLFVELPGEPEE
ncbi:16S rRNA processing protein RimM [Kineococcus radiotolerans]|uniref:Ribosome maturation factor RimM n=1 Tax=Kineococcus radiotolerans TaxID=131568 RepID=A0A7W4XW01_KINRA|nr:ribosome maturation factor RimM [Kineococcus radiotolerans]MBB2899912.1 16S rRNA processing protein RimM [Kineococcus radiotolerans]